MRLDRRVFVIAPGPGEPVAAASARTYAVLTELTDGAVEVLQAQSVGTCSTFRTPVSRPFHDWRVTQRLTG